MEPISISGLQHISEVIAETDEIIRKYKSGELRPYKTFSEKLNKQITGIYRGDQVVIAARSGVGKSAFVTLLVKNLAHKYNDIVFVYWSWEMRSWQNVIRMYSSEATIPVKHLLSADKPLDEETYVSLVNAGQELKTIPMYFRDIPVNYKDWERKVEEIQALFPDKTILNIIDHTRLVTSANEKTEEEKITNLMLAGVRVKNKLECINIFLSQLNRKIEDGEKSDVGKTGILPSYIFGADSVMQCATLVIGLHRPEMYDLSRYRDLDTKNLFVVQILKQREGELCHIAMYHNLGINRIVDSPEQLTQRNTYNI